MKRIALKLLIAAVSTFILTSGSICASAAELETNTDNQNEQVVLIGNSDLTTESNTKQITSESTENTNFDKDVLTDTKKKYNLKINGNLEKQINLLGTDRSLSNKKTAVLAKNQLKAEKLTTTDTAVTVDQSTTTGAAVTTEYSGITDLGNTSLDKSAYASLNTMTYGQIKAEGEQRWYLTKVDKGQKLTAFLGYKAESAIDLNLYLFKYNESDGSISQVAYSALNGKSTTSNEQLSYISDGGYYFMCVNSAGGFDVNNKYQLILISSNKYDSSEPDDSITQRKILSGIPTTISQTIDNAFDVDWIQFTVPENKNISGTFQNASSNGTYKMTIYDHNLDSLGTLTQGQNFNGLFAAGAYLIKVEAISGADANTPYNITFTPYDNFNTRKTVSGSATITDSIDNALDENWIEYSTTESTKLDLSLTNPNSNTKYVVDLCNKNSAGNLVIAATINQGDLKSVLLSSGTCYLRVRSVNGYDPNTKYTLNLKVDSNYLCSSGDYVVTTNSDRNALYINGAPVSLEYIPSSAYYPGGDASSHVTMGGNSKITNYGIVNYQGKTCVCIEVSDVFIYTWVYANHGYNYEHLTVPLGQFVIDLQTGQCIDGGVLKWV